MFDFQSEIQNLPDNLKVGLASFPSLTLEQQIALRSTVLKTIVTPKNKVKALAIGLSYLVARNYKFTNATNSLEIASTLLGGHLGYYSIEILKQLSEDQYVATGLEESLFAALGGLLGSKLVSKVNVTEEDHTIAQTYNFYVYFMHLLPVLLRTRYIEKFDELYPVGAMQ